MFGVRKRKDKHKELRKYGLVLLKMLIKLFTCSSTPTCPILSDHQEYERNFLCASAH